MNIDRSKHNKYTAGAVYGNLTTGGISTDESGNVTGTGLQYSGNIIYVGGGGGGSVDPELMQKMLNQDAYSYMNISNGTYTVNASAKLEKDYLNLNILGDNDTVETLVSKDSYLNKTFYDATGLQIGKYGVEYKKILVPEIVEGEPVEVPKWVITLEKTYGNPIFVNTDFNGIQLFKDDVEIAVYSVVNSRVTVNSDEITGMTSIIISNPEPVDFTEIRIIKAGDYSLVGAYINIAIISDIVIQEYITVTITQAGATAYWKLDDKGSLYTTYDTYVTKSLGAYDKIWSNYGYTVGNYVQGLSGGAFYVVDQLLNTYLEVDKLKVRKKAYFETLEIVNVNSIGGKLIISPAGAVTLNKVETYGTYYRCYFLGTQDGVEVENRFKPNDLAFSLNFNIKKPGIYEQVANHYFWRKVNAVSIEPDANGNHWIDLDKIDCDIDSDIPHINDVVAQLGNKADTDRLSAMIFSSVDVESPRILLCHGISTYTLASKEYFDLGVNHLTNQAYMNVYGNAYIGAKDGSTYIDYTQANGLNIKAHISASSTYKGKPFDEVFVQAENFDESVKAVVGDDLEFLLNQIDGNVESYFYEYKPTSDNYPANTWIAEMDKLRHNGDTFTNIQKYVDDVTTPDAGKSWRWIKNSSSVWLWTPISDSDAVLALKKAGEAQDTADGKRRVFTKKPETADTYDIGDLWVNATYIDTVGLTIYSNDLLRAKKAKLKGIGFNITDWELASKYTDDTLASGANAVALAALKAAEDAGKAANAALGTIDDYKDVIDDVFQDGIITASEKNRLNSLKDTINTTLFDVLTTYNKVYNNTNLNNKVEKSRLKTAFDSFSAAATGLVNAVTSILDKVINQAYLITKGDIAVVDTAYVNFNTRYTVYVGALGDANLEITNSISSTAYTNAVNKYAWLNGLFDPDQVTTIDGGVVTTGVLALGKTTSGVFKVNAGINGASNSSYIGSGPAIWFGGDMLDKDNYSLGNRPANVATSMFRFDGSGYLGYKPSSDASKDHAPIWWDATGNIHANPLSFFVGEETVGLLLASFQAVDSNNDGKVDYIVPKAPFTHLQMGNGYLAYDAATNSIYVYTLDGSGNKQVCNFYAYGEVSAYGSGSGEAPGSAQYLDELKDVQFTGLVSGQILGYNGSKWVNIDKPTSGASTWADITGKPTTLAGYGITDGVLTSDARLTNARPASDVSAWAKAVNKPSYTWTEISSKPSWIGSTKPNYSYSEITGTPPAPDLTAYVKKAGDIMTGNLTAPNISTTVGAYFSREVYLPEDSYAIGATTRPRIGRFDRPSGATVLQLGSNNTFEIIDTAWNRVLFRVNGLSEPMFYVPKNAINIDSFSTDIGLRITQNTSSKAYIGWSTTYGAYMYNSSSGKVIHITDSGIPSFSGNTLLHAGNYNSYAPSLTGGGASGTWGINITGISKGLESINTATGNNMTDKPCQLWYWNNWQGDMAGTPAPYMCGLNMRSSDVDYGMQLGTTAFMDVLYFRKYKGGAYKSWQVIATTDSNVYSATKLQTARSIWGQPFDGTSNVSGHLYLENGYIYRNVNGTPKTVLDFHDDGSLALNYGLDSVRLPCTIYGKVRCISPSSDGQQVHKIVTSTSAPYGLITNILNNGTVTLQSQREHNNSECFSLILNPNGGNVGIGTTSPVSKLDVAGDIRSYGWLRTISTQGWYNETYGGGIYMEDATWIRTYNRKQFYCDNVSESAIHTAGGVHASGRVYAGGYIKAENGIRVRYDEGSWISMATRDTCIIAERGNSPSAAHCLYRTKWNNGCAMCYGGLGDMIGFFAFSATNIANGINSTIWSTYWNSNGTIMHGGSFVAAGEVTAYSDIRLKSNITNLSFRGKLTPKTYIKDGKQSIGFIAQEVQQLYPELISVGSDENHYLSLNYGCITAVLSSQINKVEDEVYVLKNRVKQLEDKLKVYESRVSTFI